MVLKNFCTRAIPSLRKISTSSALRAGHSYRGVVGSNLPFPVDNKFVLTGIFIAFFSSGIALPFLILRRQILSKNQ